MNLPFNMNDYFDTFLDIENVFSYIMDFFESFNVESSMSVMADKAPTSSPQQVPPQWNYNMNMYNMYQNPYMYQTGYGAQNYYQYYAAAYVTPPQQQDNNTFRGFTPGGHLMPFQQHSQQQQNTIQQSFQQQETQEQHNVLTSKNECDLPPLPPGPPPQQNGYIHPPQQPTPQPQQIEQPRMYPPANNGGAGPGPIRFNMNNQRARMNLVPTNPFNQTQTRPQVSKKNKKKKKKQQQQQQQQLQLQQQQQKQHQQAQLAQSCQAVPPLPATPPPLPPPPPPPPPPPSEQKLEAVNQNGLLSQQQLLGIQQPSMIPPPPPVISTYQPQLQKQQLDNQQTQQQPDHQQQAIRTLEEWPQSLRDYVNRCYSKCVTQMDKDRVGVILKGKLMRATNDGTLWMKDWTAEPLPLLESDSKAQMNLKEKLSKLALRLGPKQRSPSPPKKERRGRNKRSYRSDSSSSESSDSDSYRERSTSPRNRDQNKGRNNRSTVKKSQKQKRNHNNYKHDLETSHYYSEYGLIGSHVQAKKEVLDKRAARFSTGNGGNSAGPVNNTNNTSLKKKYTNATPLYVLDHGPSLPNSSVQLGGGGGINQSNGSAMAGYNTSDWETMDLHIVGTCEDLEKPYLRLTSAPEASQVRPKEILKKSLEMVKGKWKENKDYHYCCEQLKSIRQDLTVQGIRDDFSVKVYETHGRIALEKGDHAEFNQCQSQLRILHTEVKASQNRAEFVAYRLLYYVFTKEFLDLSSLVSCLSEEDKKDECISHAVSVVKAWLIGSYHKIFKLYQTAPRMSSYLMDLFMLRERTCALKIIVKAYRPSVPIDFIRDELAFEADTETQDFLTRFGLAFTDDTRSKIDCKASTAILNAPPPS
ncbi:leukocyte receptor cluster member 8 homolog isoform X2 [Rhodnius prolixus]